MNTNPAGVGVVVSSAFKTVLVALAALGWAPLDDTKIAAVTLAVAALVDVLVYFGLVKPKVNQLQAQAAQAAETDPQPAALPRRVPGQHSTTFRSDHDLR